MLHHLKLTHHRYSGQVQPHEHTSYLALAFLVVLVGLVLGAFTASAYADHPPPQAGSVSLSGQVPAPPPHIAATISTPSNGQHFSTSPITVAGTCTKNTIVEVFKNNIFAGSTPCTDSGNFSLQIDLLFGRNLITAQVYDVLNQAGPISKSVTVYYDASLPTPAPASAISFIDRQLLLNTDAAFRGVFPSQLLNVPISVIGGTPPFAINVQWGDNSNEVVPRGDNSTFNTSHAYKRAGTYKITLQGSDSNKLVAYLTVAAIVNGKPEAFAASAVNKQSVSKILMLWPLFAIIATALISFWIGEKREKRIFDKLSGPQSPQFGSMPQNPAKPTT